MRFGRSALGAIGGALLLGGCTTTWAKNGASIKDFEKDDAACAAETEKAGPWANNWQREAFHDRCLTGRGWSKG